MVSPSMTLVTWAWVVVGDGSVVSVGEVQPRRQRAKMKRIIVYILIVKISIIATIPLKMGYGG